MHIHSGFDLAKPIYERTFAEGDTLYQFVRAPCAHSPHVGLGNWFCLQGATLDSLAIISGGPGRVVAQVRVARSMIGLEGVASPQARDWGWAGGGRGGATQIFMADRNLMGLVVVGFTPTAAGVAFV